MLYFISSSLFAACQLMLLYVQVTVEQSQGVTRHFQNTAVPVADAVNFVCKEYGTDNTLVDVSPDLCISGIKCENVDVNGCDTMLTFPQLRFLCEEDRQTFSHTYEAFVGSQLATDEHMSHNMYNSLCNTSTNCKTAETVKCDQNKQSGDTRAHSSIQADDKLGHCDKRHTCEVCGKSFTRRDALTSHKRVHTCERPFKCDMCDKTFSQRHHRTVHRRTHTGEQPYKCDKCDKAFSQPNTLTSHKRTHTGEKPYKCSICQQTFSQSCSLRYHMAYVHR